MAKQRSVSRMVVTARLAVVAGIAWLASAYPAAAQLLDTYYEPVGTDLGGVPADDSRGREASRFAAGGVRAGAFIIRPDLSESFGYNSNVNGFKGGAGSLVLDTTGSVRADSGWSRNSAYVFANFNDRHYLDLPSQSFTNWSAGIGGTVDISRGKVGLDYSHQNLNLVPGNLDSITVLAPVTYRIDNLRLSATIPSHGRFTFVPDLSVTRYDYSDYQAGPSRVSQAYRNRVATQAALTTRYELAPRQDALLVARATNLSYDKGSVTGAPKRDSNGGAILAGLDFPAPGSNFRFRVLAGLQVRNFTSRAYSNLTTPIVEASVIWQPTRLTTVTLAVRRDIEDASDETIAGYTFTSARLSVDHEARRNVTLGAFAEVLQADYQSSSINIPRLALPEAGTSQTIYSTGARVTWLLNRNIRAGASFGISQHSGANTQNYLSTTSAFTIGFRL